jgi:ABC-type bacteriocin/lantibiotic exporter with double-glycine peptidase domain
MPSERNQTKLFLEGVFEAISLKGAQLFAGSIAKMPMGDNALTGDMSTRLSGRQKHRVLLVRALYKRPNILLLDEATSRLDTNAEPLVNQATKKLSMTRITIAHRPQTLEIASRLIILPLVNNGGQGIQIRGENTLIAQDQTLSGGHHARSY